MSQQKILKFNHLNEKTGLVAPNYNYHIFQDKTGNIWISSVQGIFRFDGQHVTHYSPGDCPENPIFDGFVSSPFFQDNGGFWFSTHMGLHRYDQKNNLIEGYQLTYLEDTIKYGYNLLTFDSIRQNIWLHINNNLSIFKPYSNDSKLNVIDSLQFNSESKIFQLNNSSTFAVVNPLSKGIQLKLFSADGNELKSPILSNQIFDYTINAFLIDSNNDVWLGSKATLLNFNLYGNDPPIEIIQLSRSADFIVGLVENEMDELLIATKQDGIFVFDKHSKKITAQIYSDEDDQTIPFQRSIDKIHMDNSQNLWVSSPGNGVYYSNLNNRKFETLAANLLEKSDNWNNIISLCEDTNGTIWALTESGILLIKSSMEGLRRPKKAIFKDLPFGESILFQIYCDSRNTIWVCSQQGLFYKKSEENTFKPIPYNHNLPYEPLIISITEGRASGKLLAASGNLGLFEIIHQNGNYQLKSINDRPSGGYPYLYTTKEGRFMVAKGIDSLAYLEKENLKQIISFKTNGEVKSVVLDRKENFLWICSNNNLYKFYSNQDSVWLQEEKEFPNSALNGFLQDSLGNLWISSNRGLYRYYSKTKEIKHYDVTDGLQSKVFNTRSYLKTKNGVFIFGGNQGMNFFKPTTIIDLKTKPNPKIVGIKIAGEDPIRPLICNLTEAHNISEIKKLEFEAWENNLSFDFASLEYSDPQSCLFAYHLVGVTDTFVNIGTRNSVQFGALAPDSYTLLVDATNSDGVWSNRPHKLQFRIKPPWYFSKLAIGFYIVALVALLYAYYRFRISQIQKAETLKRQEAELRQKEAEYKQLAAETETAILRLQMNPHFIFNSMNSINSYILKRDVTTASNYLHRFASLMRMILDLAAKKLISVTEEVELLEKYMETESMRFEYKFTYAFHMVDDLDGDEYVLPPMILQPFVENAILHGISGKKEKGHIEVRFWADKNYLGCSVQDNGIGRKAASEQKNKFKAHESKALAITDRRLQLLETIDGVSANRKVEDLYDENQNPTGTKITLILPIL